MTKQEKIREGMHSLSFWSTDFQTYQSGTISLGYKAVNKILKHLHSQGVVRLADNQELPIIPFFEPLGDAGTMQWYGAAAYKTLIEDSKFRRVEKLEEK